MSEQILFGIGFVFLALVLLLLSKIGERFTNVIVLIPFIVFCYLAFLEIQPILYWEKIILSNSWYGYSDWNGYNGAMAILIFLFLGGIIEILVKIFDIKIKAKAES